MAPYGGHWKAWTWAPASGWLHGVPPCGQSPHGSVILQGRGQGVQGHPAMPPATAYHDCPPLRRVSPKTHHTIRPRLWVCHAPCSRLTVTRARLCTTVGNLRGELSASASPPAQALGAGPQLKSPEVGCQSPSYLCFRELSPLGQWLVEAPRPFSFCSPGQGQAGHDVVTPPFCLHWR